MSFCNHVTSRLFILGSFLKPKMECGVALKAGNPNSEALFMAHFKVSVMYSNFQLRAMT